MKLLSGSSHQSLPKKASSMPLLRLLKVACSMLIADANLRIVLAFQILMSVRFLVPPAIKAGYVMGVHHCIKCLISVLGRALFFYQDFHFDFLLQYSLSYCWEDRPVSKEKPRSIRCFFSFLYFFLLLVVGISTTLPKKSWLRGLSSEYFSFETSLILAFLVCSNAEPFKIGLVS